MVVRYAAINPSRRSTHRGFLPIAPRCQWSAIGSHAHPYPSLTNRARIAASSGSPSVTAPLLPQGCFRACPAIRGGSERLPRLALDSAIRCLKLDGFHRRHPCPLRHVNLLAGVIYNRPPNIAPHPAQTDNLTPQIEPQLASPNRRPTHALAVYDVQPARRASRRFASTARK